MRLNGKEQNKSVFIWFLSIYLFLMPLDFLPIVPGVSLSRFLIAFPLFGMLTELPRFKKIKYSAFPVLLYVAAAFISTLFTVNFAKSQERMIQLILNIGIIILFSARRYTERELKQILRALAYSGWFLLILSLLYSDFSYAFGRMTVVVNGKMQDPNELCGYFIFPICYYLWGFIINRKWKNLVPVLAFLIVILLTGSRGGLLALFVASVFLLIRSSVYSKKTLFKIFVIFFIMCVFLYFIWDYIPDLIQERFSLEFSINDGGAHRFDIWKHLLDYFGDSSIFRKVFGYGVATVTEYSWDGRVAHNIYLESLVEMGLVGFVFIMGMYGYYVSKAKKSFVKYLYPVLIGYLVLAFSLSLYSYKPIWNIILIIVISLGIENREMQDGKQYAAI